MLKQQDFQLKHSNERQKLLEDQKAEEECRHLEEELDIQKDRRQKALLHLQWKVTSDEPQEVTSRKACISYMIHENHINYVHHIYMISVVFLLYVGYALHKCNAVACNQHVKESRQG
ncbi:hypothetical protein HanPI659440_Chr02g0085481 [Helianthus annuus]|nr:hypothetical protein HanPI659440_Chr02g0085481 [Helianthus annuus]